MNRDPKDLRAVARRLGFPAARHLALPALQGQVTASPMDDVQTALILHQQRQAHAQPPFVSMAEPNIMVPVIQGQEIPPGIIVFGPNGPYSLPASPTNPLAHSTRDFVQGPDLVFFNPGDGNAIDARNSPCFPEEEFWAEVGFLLGKLGGKFLREREAAARRLGELAIECPFHPLVAALLRGFSAEMRGSDPRTADLADRALKFIKIGIWDCPHALQIMQQEIASSQPNAARFTSAANFLYDPKNDCRIEIAGIVGRGWIGPMVGLDGDEDEGQLQELALRLGVVRRPPD